MKRILPLVMELVFLASVMPAPSAQITTEQFSAGANGWQGSSAYGTGSWVFTGGAARVNFSDTGFISLPDVATLSNLTTGSGGSFTGNYDTAGVELIGFSFLSNTSMPASVGIVLGGPTTVYQRIYYPTQTGVWHTFAASLKSVELGGWTNLQGPITDFDQVRQNVKYVNIRVERAGATARQYLIDNIFIDRLPAAGSLAASTGGLVSLRADYLRTNLSYQIQSSPEVTGTWSLAQTMVATNRSQSIEVTNSASRLFWRLVMP